MNARILKNEMEKNIKIDNISPLNSFLIIDIN